jgi:hypothetical protein
MTLPDKLIPNARDVANGGFLLGMLSVGSLFLTGRTGGYSLYAGAAFAVATLLVGIVAVVMRRKLPEPRPVQPVLALWFGIVLVVGFLFIVFLLSQIGNHR